MDERRMKARRRALRAAQVVTLALALGTGCSSKDGPGDGGSFDAATADASTDAGFDAARVDGGSDAAVADAGSDGGRDAGFDAAGADAGSDAGFDAAGADAGSDAAVADAGFDAGCVGFPPTTRECCEAAGGSWNEESGRCFIAVPGPFVPPSMA